MLCRLSVDSARTLIALQLETMFSEYFLFATLFDFGPSESLFYNLVRCYPGPLMFRSGPGEGIDCSATCCEGLGMLIGV